MAPLPCVLCIDLEPDRRAVERGGPLPAAGLDALFPLVPRLRDRLSSVSGAPANLTWFLRMDPQVTEAYGAPDWLVVEYERELDRLQAEGDELGVHCHSWRWDDGWVSDHGDPAWVAHCVQVGLDTFRTAFDRVAPAFRHGDGFMSEGVAQQIDEAGVRVDLTVEPGHLARGGLLDSERATGALPDTRTVPHHAYRPRATDFRVPDDERRDGVLFVPLTPGLVVSTGYRDGRMIPTASYDTLQLWREPVEFARMLRAYLREPHLSHLAFVIRSDLALLPDDWSAMERNLDELGRQYEPGHQWCTALEAVQSIDSRTPVVTNRGNGHGRVDAERATLWLRGADDAGYRAGAEPEALEVLMEGAGAAVGRLRSLGVDVAVHSADVTNAAAAVTPARPPVAWVDEQGTAHCPVCGYSGPAPRFATAPWGHLKIGVLRCVGCGAIVPERVGPMADLPDTAINDHVEFAAGIDAILTTLSPIEPTRGLRFLDVGCGYGFGLDLAEYAWDWRGVGVDPWNLALRGREELGVDIRAAMLDSSLDLGDEPFDVVLASEVLEHTQAPLVLLREIRRCLAPDGVLVLSTPNAGFVRPDNPAHEVAAALSVGGHAFLVDQQGLEKLLTDAGFGAFDVHSDAQTLHAVASLSPGGLARCRPSLVPLDLGLLARYCGDRATSAPPGSALALGMASRHVQYALYAGDLPTAEAGYERLRGCLATRHDAELDDPAATMRVAAEGPVAPVVALAHYNAGFLELVARLRPERAAAQFAAAALAANAAAGGRNPAVTWLQLRAIGHEALALARYDPARVPDVLRRLRQSTRDLVGEAPEIDTLVALVFRELVALGHDDESDAVRMLVSLPERWVLDDDAMVMMRSELDTVFALGVLALRRSRAAEAMAYFGLCARLADGWDDPDAVELVAQARVQEATALERLMSDDSATIVAPALVAPVVAGAPEWVEQDATERRSGVSVVMPLFDGARYLRAALESVMAQTQPPDEMLVVDDGSSDNGPELLGEVDAPFPIRLIRQPHAGQSEARNRGVASSQGELVAFLDQDDLWHPEHLARLTKPLHDDTSIGWVYSDFDEIDTDGHVVTLSFMAEHRIIHPRTTLAACLSEDLMVIPSASVIRRSMLDALGGFDGELGGYEDDDLYVRAFRAGWRLAYVRRSLTRFRVHEASSSAQVRFRESRRRFSDKLRATIPDDRRLNRYYGRDVVGPRFLRSALNDYIRAISDHDWTAARTVRVDLLHFADFHRDRSSLRWKLVVTRSPRLFRVMLRLNGALPLRPRRLKDPMFRLR